MHPVYDCFDPSNHGKLQCISLVRHPHFLIELQCASSSSWILLLTAPAPQSRALWHFPGLRPTSLNCKQANKRKGSSLRILYLISFNPQPLKKYNIVSGKKQVKGRWRYSGKTLVNWRPLHLGIAQIAIGPPPALNRALWGTSFWAIFLPFWRVVCFQKR